ncbi:MAG: FecR domain-containing protein [Candidatus Pseudobacter hemicellulosilyticus]|uniref:FecR domain-containing protein n=1 Tax=Candidatus Pseudobacter hemicellulosilyticus TaxID=3121375 RepID=A0AAJ6BJF1_9BACT|nr:MAG: FecR domain-containing protein [Pseudobacter sp.]
MELPKNDIDRLLQAWQAQLLSREEYEALFRALADPAHREQVEAYLDQRLLAQPAEATALARELDWEGMFRRIIGPEQPPQTVPVHRVHFLRRWGWAAAVLLVLLGAGTLYLLNQNPGRAVVVQEPGQDIQPGKEGAILTLADGRQVVLDSLGNGVIAEQNGARVVLEKGKLNYLLSERSEQVLTYNTMSTPRGRQFMLQLPDGSRVWLNAASSLRYPTAFQGKERRVELTGEAYFEVAPNKGQPFFVTLNNQATVEVLGTRFNANAYGNEQQLDATLLEGSVRVVSGSSRVVLEPGQNARINGSIQVQREADINQVIAWKNGLFNFEGKKLREVMRQLERWYDIEVVVQPEVPDIEFYGEINRDISLAGMLKALKLSDVRFAMDGRKLTVLR